MSTHYQDPQIILILITPSRFGTDEYPTIPVGVDCKLTAFCITGIFLKLNVGLVSTTYLTDIIFFIIFYWVIPLSRLSRRYRLFRNIGCWWGSGGTFCTGICIWIRECWLRSSRYTVDWLNDGIGITLSPSLKNWSEHLKNFKCSFIFYFLSTAEEGVFGGAGKLKKAGGMNFKSWFELLEV